MEKIESSNHNLLVLNANLISKYEELLNKLKHSIETQAHEKLNLKQNFHEKILELETNLDILITENLELFTTNNSWTWWDGVMVGIAVGTFLGIISFVTLKNIIPSEQTSNPPTNILPLDNSTPSTPPTDNAPSKISQNARYAFFGAGGTVVTQNFWRFYKIFSRRFK